MSLCLRDCVYVCGCVCVVNISGGSGIQKWLDVRLFWDTTYPLNRYDMHLKDIMYISFWSKSTFAVNLRLNRGKISFNIVSRFSIWPKRINCHISSSRCSLKGTYNGKVFKTAEIKCTLDITLHDYPMNIIIDSMHCSGGSRISQREQHKIMRGCANLSFCKIFCWKLHENERIWTEGAHVSGTPLDLTHYTPS